MMRMDYKRRLSLVGFVMAGLACVPAVAQAQQMEPSMRVERTPAYVLTLAIGPAETMAPAMDMHPGMANVGMPMDAGMGMNSGPAMTSAMADQGMAVNHRLDVRITAADSGSIVTDVTPTIRITDKSTGEARDLPQVMGMYGAGMAMTDYRYGQNVFLPDGTYQVAVLVGPQDNALFRDVTVMAAAPMMEMSMDHGMATPPAQP
jgi:hypothetical protein